MGLNDDSIQVTGHTQLLGRMAGTRSDSVIYAMEADPLAWNANYRYPTHLRFPYNTMSVWKILFRRKGSIFKVIWKWVLLEMLIALAVSAITYFTGNENWGVSPRAHSSLLSFISFILIFRTSQSYQRYWTSKTAVQNINNSSNHLNVQIYAYIKGEDDTGHAIRTELQRNMWVVIESIAEQTFGDDFMDHALEHNGKISCEEDTEQVDKYHRRNLPYAFAAKFSNILKQCRLQGRVNSNQIICMERNLHGLTGAFELMIAIQDAPIPFPYVQILNFFLITYTSTLILVLNQHLGWYSCLYVGILSGLFFGINAIGIEIEDPFGQDENDFDMCYFNNQFHRETEEIRRGREEECQMITNLEGLNGELSILESAHPSSSYQAEDVKDKNV